MRAMTDPNEPSGAAKGASRQPPPGPVRDLPIGEVLAAGFRSVFIEHRALLPQAVLLPFLLSIVMTSIGAAGPGSFPVRLDDTAGSRIYELSWFAILGATLPYIWFAVTWHRLVLLGASEARPTWISMWGARHWRFFGHCLLLGAVTVAWFITALLAFAMFNLFVSSLGGGSATLILLGGGIVAAFVGLGWLYARLSFVFPAAAVDEAYRTVESWNHTRRQGLRVLLAMASATLPFLALSILLSPLLLGPDVAPISDLSYALTVFLRLGLGYLAAAVGVSVLALSFTACTGWIPATIALEAELTSK